MLKLITIFFLAFSSISYAAPSGSLLLRGTVPNVMSIVVNADPLAQTLDLIAGMTNIKIGSATEQCNALNGYSIQLSSVNAGSLVHSVDATRKIGYQLSYNGGAMAKPSALPITVKNVPSLTTLTTNTSNINITIPANPNAVSGIYNDTVTISIIAN